MKLNELKHAMQNLVVDYSEMSENERRSATQMLIGTANFCVEQQRKNMSESDAAANRRKSKRRETELDPKPPVSPVRVASPSAPKKPKYAGNHAPK
jgi:hypothetical protein